MVALKQGKLSVTYSSELRNKVDLDEEEVRRRLEAESGRMRASRRNYGSGARAWAAWETLTEGKALPRDGGSLWYRLTPGNDTKVTVFRNGMRITDDALRLRSHDFRGIKAFSAVLDADGDLAAAIKECETDSHLEIKVQQAPEEFGTLTLQGLQAVQDALKEAVGELETDEWVPDVLRIFDAEQLPSKIEPAPPRRRPPQPESPQPPLPEPEPEPGSAPPGPGPGPGPGPERAPRSVKPQAWRPGSVEGVRRSLVPVNGTEAVVEWDFTGESRRPSNVGVSVVVGSGSLPSDRRPAPDRALLIRPEGGDDDEWAEELKLPAAQGFIRVEVRDVPTGWEAVTAVVSRRA